MTGQENGTRTRAIDSRESRGRAMPSMEFFAHPFSSYGQKVLIALYENDIPFQWRVLKPDDERTAAEHAARWPLKRMPVLVDADRTIVEATIIIEYLAVHHPGPVRLIPLDADAA